MLRKLVQFIERSKSTNNKNTPVLTCKLNKEPNLLKVLYSLSIILVSIYIFFMQIIEYREENLHHAIKNSQAVLMNINTNHILNGQLLKQNDQEIYQTSNKPEMDNEKNNIRGKIAIIVTDLGLNKANTLKALQLPQNITLGFSPYPADIGDWLDKAASYNGTQKLDC